MRSALWDLSAFTGLRGLAGDMVGEASAAGWIQRMRRVRNYDLELVAFWPVVAGVGNGVRASSRQAGCDLLYEPVGFQPVLRLLAASRAARVVGTKSGCGPSRQNRAKGHR